MMSIKQWFKKYFFQIAVVFIGSTWAIFGYINQSKDLEENGQLVDGVIIECKIIKMKTACSVKVEFYTTKGEKRISSNILNNSGNCVLGKKVKVIYSTKSELVEVLD